MLDVQTNKPSDAPPLLMAVFSSSDSFNPNPSGPEVAVSGGAQVKQEELHERSSKPKPAWGNLQLRNSGNMRGKGPFSPSCIAVLFKSIS